MRYWRVPGARNTFGGLAPWVPAQRETTASRGGRFLARVLLTLLFLGGAISTCFSQLLVEEALLRGVDYGFFVTAGAGSGIGLNDLDGDGDLDLVLAGGQTLGLFENDGDGYFSDRSAVFGPSALYSGVAAADYDADGDLDLYISAYGSANLLLRNDGAFQFVDVAVALGVADVRRTSGCSWGDFDGDGWLDLYVVNHGLSNAWEESAFFRNDEGQGFVEVTQAAGVFEAAQTFQPAFFDYDRDGDVDLYLTNDRGYVVPNVQNRLFRNDGGVFFDASDGSGADLQINAMGLAIGDLDRNGYPDLYITNTVEGNVLLMNQGNGTFVDATTPSATQVNEIGWGTLFEDLDNNSYLELLVANRWAPNQMFTMTSTGTFPMQNIAVQMGWGGNYPTYCIGAGDIDGDGDVDIIQQDSLQSAKIFVNNLSNGFNWIAVALLGEGANTHGVGATVEVVLPSGVVLSRQVVAGYGYKGSQPLQLHFGVGAAATISQLRVHWPGGRISTWNDIAASTQYWVQPANAVTDRPGWMSLIYDSLPLFKRGDADADGELTLQDAITVLLYQFGVIPSECWQPFDVNDDDEINLEDAIHLLSHVYNGGAAPAGAYPDCEFADSALGLGIPQVACTSNQTCP